MDALNYAYSFIRLLSESGVESVCEDRDESYIPREDESPLVTLSSSSIAINGVSLNDRLTPSKVSRLDTGVSLEDVASFLEVITSVGEVSLNHLGISYYCTDLDLEVKRIQSIVGPDDVYEETSGVTSTKWLFIGNVNKPKQPLFEIVLNERDKPTLSSWVPHIQIDIDTELNIEELRNAIENNLGKDWIKWDITIDGLGTLLVMGRLCSIDGVKVYLGVGTNKRDREWHRKNGLKKL